MNPQDKQVLIDFMNTSINEILFEEIIHILSNKNVLPHNNQNANDTQFLEKMKRAANNVIGLGPVAGDNIEALFEGKLRDQGVSISSAITQSGRGKAKGYPLWKIVFHGTRYLTFRTFEKKNEGSVQRTFYFSPPKSRTPTDFKVTDDAKHYLIGFWREPSAQPDEIVGEVVEEIVEQEEDVNHGNGSSEYLGFNIVDLYGKEIRIKLEFNQGNKGLYDNPLYSI